MKTKTNFKVLLFLFCFINPLISQNQLNSSLYILRTKNNDQFIGRIVQEKLDTIIL